MLWDFEGVFACIDDARALYDLRSSAGAATGAAAGEGYEDPWAVVADKETANRWRAAGWSVDESWARRIRGAIWGLGVPPPPDADIKIEDVERAQQEEGQEEMSE